MHHTLVQQTGDDAGSDHDGINIVLMGGAWIILLLISGALYLLFRGLQAIRRRLKNR